MSTIEKLMGSLFLLCVGFFSLDAIGKPTDQLFIVIFVNFFLLIFELRFQNK
jgi:hypothetical protein